MPSSGYNLGPAFGPQAGPLNTGALDTAFALPQTAFNTLVNFSNAFVDSSGAPNQITVTVPAPLVFSYVFGVKLQVLLANTNTSGTVNINVNGLGNKSVVQSDGSNVNVGALLSSRVVELFYDGASFVVLSQLSSMARGLFSNGTAAAPSMSFIADPATGVYSSGTGNLDFSTGGVRRLNIDANGGIAIQAPSTAETALTINGAGISGSIISKIINPFSSTSTTPILSLQSTASNGFAQFSILGNAGTGVIGTDDLSIFQNGTNYDVTVINRHSGAALNLAATGSPNGVVNIVCNGTNVAAFGPGSGGNAIIGVAGNTDAIGFRTLTQSTVGAAGGASALPATPLGYMTVTVNGAAVKMAYYNP